MSTVHHEKVGIQNMPEYFEYLNIQFELQGKLKISTGSSLELLGKKLSIKSNVPFQEEVIDFELEFTKLVNMNF